MCPRAGLHDLHLATHRQLRKARGYVRALEARHTAASCRALGRRAIVLSESLRQRPDGDGHAARRPALSCAGHGTSGRSPWAPGKLTLWCGDGTEAGSHSTTIGEVVRPACRSARPAQGANIPHRRSRRVAGVEHGASPAVVAAGRCTKPGHGSRRLLVYGRHGQPERGAAACEGYFATTPALGLTFDGRIIHRHPLDHVLLVGCGSWSSQEPSYPDALIAHGLWPTSSTNFLQALSRRTRRPVERGRFGAKVVQAGGLGIRT
jgi:hypothetical protein